MGTWGAGNLESDGALDEVGERSTALVLQLWDRLRRATSWEADEWEHDALFVDFETVFALEAGGVFNGWSLPRVQDVDPVLDAWLVGWRDYFPSLEPAEGHMAEREAVITRTFARFREICAKYQAQRQD